MEKYSTEYFACKIAGSKYAIETASGAIKDWSPNNIEGVLITTGEDNSIVVEVYQYLGERVRKIQFPPEFKSRVVSSLNLMFQRRKYSCLSFFVWFYSVPSFGIDPSKTLKYLTKQPLLAYVGQTNVGSTLEQTLANAEGKIDPEGYEGVYLQPATYEMDIKIKSALDKVKNKENVLKMLDKDIKDTSKYFNAVKILIIGEFTEQNPDFKDCYENALYQTEEGHKLGVSDEDLNSLLYHVQSNAEYDSIVFDLLNHFNLQKENFKKDKDDYVKSSNYVIRVVPFLETFENKYKDQVAGKIGHGVLALYLDKIEELDLLSRLEKLLRMQEILEGRING